MLRDVENYIHARFFFMTVLQSQKIRVNAMPSHRILVYTGHMGDVHVVGE